jgi:hypothetical protein
MTKWLAIGAAASVVWMNAASAQMRHVVPPEIAGDARTRALDARMTHDLRTSQQAPLPIIDPVTGGMLVSRDVAPNATLGFGFTNMSVRKKTGAYVGINAGGRSRRPAVTFVLHF